MKKRIIKLTIGLTGLVTIFLPQKAVADYCIANCANGVCTAFGSTVICACIDGEPVCSS